jgi:hypothetical protein
MGADQARRVQTPLLALPIERQLARESERSLSLLPVARIDRRRSVLGDAAIWAKYTRGYHLIRRTTGLTVWRTKR